MDNTSTIKQIIEKHIRWTKEVHIASTDFQRAYDSIPVNRLWKEIEKIEVS
jgi:hypothetical protein